MQSAKTAFRIGGFGVAAARTALGIGREKVVSVASSRLFVRYNSTKVIIPTSMQPKEIEIKDGPISTRLGELSFSDHPKNVRPELWKLFVATIQRMESSSEWKPKKRMLHLILLNATSKEELDMAFRLTEQWRIKLLPIVPATTYLWAKACVRLQHPEPFITMLMDRWKYRQMPAKQTLAYFIKFLGSYSAETYALAKESKGEESEALLSKADQLLDDAFRVFALYPYYEIDQDASAYGALIEACCLVNTEEAWRRALVVSEETLAINPPRITLEALKSLEDRSNERSESSMAKRYQELAKRSDLEPVREEDVNLDVDRDLLLAIN
ncbi:hypothetical protein COEREDRAFT_10637 [Coemansia reversa NRRL 1564]|uniref:Uncharacterized protein n=1 Tax=Coemansia reversa (strain ATCC 12441 / NRRL 1564) TaxID=763665 RepID=A0A2G5B5W2_COERN|nr:hypothetical protein COEREDRAFT_10637 [Coemansia reversa NRRL 1564]|eukprot:PIA14107.1 hypothetical protein COEREDRAFT_10637 [Coemansia reversa NRRL 1564]